MVNWFSKIPGWAALSLIMNGLLFAALIALWQNQASLSRTAILHQTSASVTDVLGGSEPMVVPTDIADMRHLNYQEWVELLQQKTDAMVAQQPEHLTILLGDSLSLWFPPELMPGRRAWLKQGISGEKTNGLINRLALLDDAKIETIFLMIGINDLIWGQTDDQFIDNYRAIVSYLTQNHPESQIVIQSLLPHGGEASIWESKHLLLELPVERVKAINAALHKIADDYDAYYLDLYPLFSTGEGTLRPDLTTDGLHLNRQGYLVWRSAIALYAQLELTESRRLE
ncbi:GDSL-type esterase/lipase family protein [Vasconcelosia minhoensis]|uniref:GDSL-type esterase/lipase family protein n=1 Tax=Vasconcelosia minhoensis TaxID=3366354 RepID=UPI002AD4098B|nr:GDSL-type esterase/lipase family protein [Romeria gracilis]